MLRRLPILIAPILCTGCFTFFTSIDEPPDHDGDADTSDMMVADMDSPADDGTPNNRLDMNVPDDGGDLPSDMDTSDAADVSDMPADAGDMGGRYMWDGQSTGGLSHTSQTCVAASNGHPQLANRPSGSMINPKISFVGLYGLDQPTAQLAWVQNGVGQRAQIEYRPGMAPSPRNGDQFQIVGTGMFNNPSNGALNVSEVMVGADDTPENWIRGVTTGNCQLQGDVLILGEGPTATTAVDCPGQTLIETLEAAGGYNPFNPASAVPRSAVWQESMTNDVVVSSHGQDFPFEQGISGAWSPSMRASDNFLLTNRGAHIFLPDTDGTLWSWDTAQPGDMTDMNELPPEVTTITGVERGSVATAFLDSGRYVVARRVLDAIEIRVYAVSASTVNRLDEVGLWYVVTGLDNPDGVELATFSGGFALWYQEHDPDASSDPNQWTVHVFGVTDDMITRYDCPYTYEYSELDYLDNDLAAWRLGNDLVVAGAVHYQLDGQTESSINVEGPYFEGLFQ